MGRKLTRKKVSIHTYTSAILNARGIFIQQQYLLVPVFLKSQGVKMASKFEEEDEEMFESSESDDSDAEVS